MLFYLPFMHGESLLFQVAAASFYDNFAHHCQSDSQSKSFAASSTGFGEHCRDVIDNFGRFISRSTALGKNWKPEELSI